MALNPKPIVVSNAGAYGTGWSYTAEGAVQLLGAGFVNADAMAAVQPYMGTVRRASGAGFQRVERLRLFFQPSAAGAWPTVSSGVPASTLPTRVTWAGQVFEVQAVKDRRGGLRPHIYAEAELLDLVRPTTSAPDGEGTVW